MTVEDIRNDILFQLGDPVVEVEVKEFIPKCIDMAFREMKHYISDSQTVTVPYQNKIHIDLEKIPIDTVILLQRSKSPYAIADFSDIMYLMSRQDALQYTSLTGFSRAALTNQIKNTISTDLDFYWDKDNADLYVYANYPKPVAITIVYIPDFKSVEDIKEPYWQNLLRRLSLAYTKEMLGRVRSKYTLNSATYNLDGQQLLAEAQQEISEIRTFLDENEDLILPID